MNRIAFVLSGPVCSDARAFLGLSQEEFASAARVSVSTVRRCERGERISEYASRQILGTFKTLGAVFIAGRLQE